MIRLLSLIFLCSLMGTWTFAADMKQNANAIQSKLDGNTFTAELSSGLHFNAKAPNVVIVDEKRVSPKKLDRQKAVFILPKTFSKAQASLYYCDDAETFCLPQQIDIAGSGQGAKSEKIVKKENATKSAKPNKHGFIEDDIAAAVAQAKKEKKLILADFSARWCPGCVRLETEIFNTAAFKGATKGFVKLKLDSDRFQNQELKIKYGIWAIPSLLVLTTDLDEVSRIVDYQPMPTLKRFFEDAQKTPQPFAVLKKKANSGDKTATEALGRRLYLAGKHTEALPYLEKVDPQPIEYLDAKAQAAMKKYTDPKQRGDLQRVLREVIAAEPSSTRSNVWRLALVEAVEKPAEKKKIALEGADLADDLLAHREKIPNAVKGDLVGEFAGYEPLLIASQKADLIAAGGFNEELEMEAWKQVTTIGREMKIPTKLAGPSLRYLIFLTAAKEFPEAEKQAKAMLKRNPKDPELQRRLLRILNEQGKFAEAIPLGKDTLHRSYGKNEVWVAQQLAKAYAGSNQKNEAKALAQNYLDRKDIDWTSMKSEREDLAKY